MGKILAMRLNSDPAIEEMDMGYESIKEFIGGYMEHVSVTDKIDLWINEEGKILMMDVNFALVHDNTVVDFVAGNAFFAGHNDEGDTIGLTEAQIDDIYARLDTTNIKGVPILGLRMGN